MTRKAPPDGSDGLSRRSVLRGVGAGAGVAALGVPSGAVATDDGDAATYRLPPLPYAYDALEPSIDERIMRLHHDAHHRGYVEGANEVTATLARMRRTGEYDGIEAAERDLAFNLSGHALHSIFWEIMSPDGGGCPSGAFADAVRCAFGSVPALKSEFSAAAEAVEGSGWGLLSYDHFADRLLVTQVENHDDLVARGATPLLPLDVWEHAYYLQYENGRGEYVDSFWNVVDWDAVAARYEWAKRADPFGPADG